MDKHYFRLRGDHSVLLVICLLSVTHYVVYAWINKTFAVIEVFEWSLQKCNND